MFMKQAFTLLKSELWYPYSEPRVASGNQVSTEGSDHSAINFADCAYPSGLDGLIFGS